MGKVRSGKVVIEDFGEVGVGGQDGIDGLVDRGEDGEVGGREGDATTDDGGLNSVCGRCETCGAKGLKYAVYALLGEPLSRRSSCCIAVEDQFNAEYGMAEMRKM